MPDLTPFEAHLAELLEADSIAGIRPVDRYAIARTVIQDGARRGSAGPFSVRRRLVPVALAILLVALLAGAAILVGSQLLTPSPALPVPAVRGAFTPTGSMAHPRFDFTATLLPDGRVLVTGGQTELGGGASTPWEASAELYDPNTGTFGATGSMAAHRVSATATLLPDGRVLIAGGDIGPGRLGSTAELYDPVTGTFSPTASMLEGRAGHAATLLRDGLVLVAGGDRTASGAPAELYDPQTGTFRTTGSMGHPMGVSTATLLQDGRVLLAGDGPAEVYDPATGTFSVTGPLPAGLVAGTTTLLPDGRVLVTGDGYAGGCEGQRSAALFDPATNTFQPTTSMTVPRQLAAGALLRDGRVLIAGGDVTGGTAGDASNPGHHDTSTAELYDPRSGTFSEPAPMTEARYRSTATLLGDGSVLVLGGSAAACSPTPALSSAELFR